MAVNIFKKAKAYRTKHPKISFQDAIQKVSGKSSVSGVKKKRVSRIEKKVSGIVKRSASIKKKISGTKKFPASPGIGKIGALYKGKKIIAEINKLELQRKKLKTKIEKDFLALIINKQHDKLDALQRQLKQS